MTPSGGCPSPPSSSRPASPTLIYRTRPWRSSRKCRRRRTSAHRDVAARRGVRSDDRRSRGCACSYGCDCCGDADRGRDGHGHGHDCAIVYAPWGATWRFTALLVCSARPFEVVTVSSQSQSYRRNSIKIPIFCILPALLRLHALRSTTTTAPSGLSPAAPRSLNGEGPSWNCAAANLPWT